MIGAWNASFYTFFQNHFIKNSIRIKVTKSYQKNISRRLILKRTLRRFKVLTYKTHVLLNILTSHNYIKKYTKCFKEFHLNIIGKIQRIISIFFIHRVQIYRHKSSYNSSNIKRMKMSINLTLYY